MMGNQPTINMLTKRLLTSVYTEPKRRLNQIRATETEMTDIYTAVFSHFTTEGMKPRLPGLRYGEPQFGQGAARGERAYQGRYLRQHTYIYLLYLLGI